MDAGPAAAIGALVAVVLYAGMRHLPDAPEYRPSPGRYPIGQRATVLTVDPPLGECAVQGRVRVGAETWSARWTGITPTAGDTLRVIDGDGIVLVCAPVDADQIPPPLPHRSATRLLGELGRPVAAVLCLVTGALALLLLAGLPRAGGLALFGLFAPMSAVLALIGAGSPSAAGFSVRGLRAVIAVTCGFAVFAGLTAGLAAAIGSVIALLILLVFDPVLAAIPLALVP
jgi:hypothetical protein